MTLAGSRDAPDGKHPSATPESDHGSPLIGTSVRRAGPDVRHAA